MAEAVLFDAGGTLVLQDPEAMSGILGVELDPEACFRAHYETMAEFSRLRLAGSTATWDWWLERYFTRLGVPDPATAGERIDRGYGLWTRVIPGVAEALRRLAAAGVRLAVVSNSDGSVRDSLARAGVGDVFEFVLDSHEVGTKKPDPEIFGSAVAKLGVDPVRVWYVGDSEFHDVHGARRAGLGRAILVDPLDLHPHVEDRIRSVAELG